MAHVDGDDYTYESICTAEQHQAEQDAKIAELSRICIAQATQNVRRMNEIHALQLQVRHLETLIHRLLNGNPDAAL